MDSNIKEILDSITSFKNVMRFIFASPALLVFLLLSLTIPLAAFEAHVVGITATIIAPTPSPSPSPSPSPFCEARSLRYWRLNEGCSFLGTGSSIWASQVNALSATYSGVFATTTGAEICQLLWSTNCIGSPKEILRCKNKANPLTLELNVASGKLNPAALLDGADNGAPMFDSLGLSPTSTISQALAAIETALSSPLATLLDYVSADYVAKRINAFYEFFNPNKPFCVFELESLQSGQAVVGSGGSEEGSETSIPSPEPDSTGSLQISPEPSPSPELSPTPQPSTEPTTSPLSSPEPSILPSSSPEPSPSPEPEPTPSPSPEPSPSASPEPTLEPTPESSPFPEPSPSPSA
jgi:hypothetical protein